MPVFMIGTQRSGSNLLRVMLSQLKEIAAPHPPHILQRMMPLVAGYGDLNNNAGFLQLIDDVCQLVENNPVPWEGVTLDRVDIMNRCRARSLVAVFGAVYDTMARAKGARTWLCKSLANIHYLDDIERYFDDFRYVYLYRDGRDVAVSFRKAVVGEKHFYHIAREWAETQRLALSTLSRLSPEQVITVSYDDLTTVPVQTMRRLCRFLGAEYDEKVLEFHESGEAQRAAASSTLWSNVTRPVMSDNSRKYLTEASADDIRLFEWVAGDVLDTLGYKRSYTQRGESRTFRESEKRVFDTENELMKEKMMSDVNQADRERRDRQAGIIEQIQQRQAAAPSGAGLG